MKSLVAKLVCAGLLFAPALFAAESQAPRRFAAPEVASAPAAGTASGIGQVMLALIVVLIAVFVAAMLVKRLRGATSSGANGIEVLSQASLGAKERVVIVRVAGQRLLLGVAAGGVSLLQTLPPDSDAGQSAPVSPTPQPPRFGELLRRSLGR